MQFSTMDNLAEQRSTEPSWDSDFTNHQHKPTKNNPLLGDHEFSLVQANSSEKTSNFWQSNRIGKVDILMFTSQLSIMCESGIDLAEALRDTSETCKHPRLKGVLTEIYNDVANGISASAAMQRHENVFGGAYIGSIAAAESSGRVGEVLNRLSQLLRNEIRLRSSLVSMFSYPAALVAISSLVILALIFFVLPQFGKVFDRMQSTPPAFTKLLLDVSSMAREHMLWFVSGAVLLIVVGYRFIRTEQAQRTWDRIVLNTNVLKNASRALITGRTFRLLGTMIESGVPLLDSIRLCSNSIRNTYFRELFTSMEQDVLNGQGIGPAINSSTFLPDGVAQMVTTAERTGRLGFVLSMVGEFYEEDGERQIQQVVKLLEPIIIVVMGIAVAGVVASVMLPLLNVSTMSR